MLFLFSIFTIYLSGFLTLSLLFSVNHTILKHFYRLLVGLGITSLIYYTYLLIPHKLYNIPYLQYESIFIVFLIILIWQQSKNRPIKSHNRHKPISKNIPLPIIFVFTLYLFSLIINAKNYPHGNSVDSIILWNMKARFLFRDINLWKNLFIAPSDWMHPDYPLLLPSSIARIWTYLKHESVLIPQFFSIFFSSINIIIIYLYLREKNILTAPLAAIILLSSSDYYYWSYAQLADIPLSSFLLLTVILINDLKNSTNNNKHIILIGLTSSFTIWCKNEGVFLWLSVFCYLFFIADKSKIRNISQFILGSLPVLFILFHYKLFLTPANDLAEKSSFDSIINNLSDLERLLKLTSYFIRSLFTFNNSYLLIIFTYLIFNKRSYIFNPLTYIILMMLFLYFLTYLITPLNMDWHLKTSLPRLLIQIWPAFILIFFSSFHNKTSEKQPEKNR